MIFYLFYCIPSKERLHVMVSFLPRPGAVLTSASHSYGLFWRSLLHSSSCDLIHGPCLTGNKIILKVFPSPLAGLECSWMSLVVCAVKDTAKLSPVPKTFKLKYMRSSEREGETSTERGSDLSKVTQQINGEGFSNPCRSSSQHKNVFL